MTMDNSMKSDIGKIGSRKGHFFPGIQTENEKHRLDILPENQMVFGSNGIPMEERKYSHGIGRVPFSLFDVG